MRIFGPMRPNSTRLPAAEVRLGSVVATTPLQIEVDGLEVVPGAVEVAFGVSASPGDACVVTIFGDAFYLVTATYPAPEGGA